MAILNNEKGGSALIRVTANATITLADLQTTGETVHSFAVTKVYWSTANTTTGIQLARNANNILKLASTGTWILDTYGISLNEDSTATLVITIPDGVSSAVVQVHKKSTWTSEYYGGSTGA